MDRYRIELTAHVRRYIETAPEAPSPVDDQFAGNTVHLIASAHTSLEAAAGLVRSQGVDAAILSEAIEGEVRESGRFQAAMTREIALRGQTKTNVNDFRAIVIL